MRKKNLRQNVKFLQNVCRQSVFLFSNGEKDYVHLPTSMYEF